MVALIIGVLFISFAVIAVWPDFLLNWWEPMLDFLRGGVPVFALFIGLIAVFIGIADIKDRIEARKEEAEEQKASDKSE